MKFKVGDKVRVREDLKVGDGFGFTTAVVDMLKYRGKIMTIKEARSSVLGNYTIYEIDDDGGSWAWTDEMLEPAYAEGGYVFYHKIPTPEKPVPIEEQLGLPKGVSIHDLNPIEWYSPSIDIVLNAEQAEELAERIKEKLSGDKIKFAREYKEDKPMAMFTFSTEEGYRYDKSNNTKIPTITTKVVDNDGNSATATCDKENYDERQGVLEAVANLACRGDFDKQYSKAFKIRKHEDEAKRTCFYCGKVFDTVDERKDCEDWHKENKKARHERYKLRKRAKEIAFEQKAQEIAKTLNTTDKE